MTWVKLDDSMTEHPKIAGLSNPAFRLYIEGLCYSARTLSDGLIPFAVAKRLLTSGSVKATAELVAAGVWEPCAAGYLIHDYHDYQPTKAKVLELRSIRSEAGKLGGRPKQTESKKLSKTKANEKQVRETPGPSPTPLDTDSRCSPVSQQLEHRRNEQWDGLAAVFGYSAAGGEAKLWGKLTTELRELGATKPSIEEAARRYRLDMPSIALTPSALVKHYQRLDARPITRPNSHSGSKADRTLALAHEAQERERHAGQ